MSFKKLAIGIAVAALSAAAPAFATADGHPNGNPIYCSDTTAYLYSEFVHAPTTTWTGGVTEDYADAGVGLRINYGGAPAGFWQMAVLESSDSDAYVFTEYLYGHSTYYTSDFDGVTITSLRNGYEQWYFNGHALPHGSHFVNIYFADYGDGYTFSDEVTNMAVNGVAVVDSHGLTEDCTID